MNLSPVEVLRAHGIEPSGGRADCPCCGEPGGLVVEPERWRCKACLVRGDAIDLEARLSGLTRDEVEAEFRSDPGEMSGDEHNVDRAGVAQSAEPAPLGAPSGEGDEGSSPSAGAGPPDDEPPHPAEQELERTPTPPFDLEAEESTLGAALWSPATAEEVAALVKAEDFYKPAHETIWRAIEAVRASGRQADAVTVKAELQQAGKLASVGGPSYIFTLLQSVPTHASGPEYAAIVADRARRRNLIDIGRGLVSDALAGSTDTSTFVSRTQDRLSSLSTGRASGFTLEAFDWVNEDVPPIEYLVDPYIPRGARILVTGPSESGKSIWALWIAAKLSREGHRVAYFSQENPRVEDKRRLERLAPDPKMLTFFHDQGLDIADRAHVSELLRACEGYDLVVLDTFTATWTGDENDNAEVKDLIERGAVKQLARAGTAVMILDHTGNPQAFIKRTGATASRGASSKGQSVDIGHVFTNKDPGFLITNWKARLGGRHAEPKQFQVVDTEGGGLDIIEVERASSEKQNECADAIVDILGVEGSMSERQLRARISHFGRNVQRAAFAQLRAEEPPRVMVEKGPGTDAKGRPAKKLNLWRTAEGSLLAQAFGSDLEEIEEEEE